MKLIIEDRTDLSLNDVLAFVHSVISAGRISNNGTQYCYLTAFDLHGRVFHVATDLNKKSDKFTIYEVPTKETPSLDLPKGKLPLKLRHSYL